MTSRAALGSVSISFALSMLVPSCAFPGNLGRGQDEGVETDTAPLTAGTTLRATTNVNLRGGPSQADAVLLVVPSGGIVIIANGTPNNGYYSVSYEGTTGW